MKKLISLLVSCAVALASYSANVTVNVHNFVSGPTVNRPITVTLVDPNGSAVAGPWLIAGDTVTLLTDTNGTCVFSNMLALGEYRLDVRGNPGRSFPFSISDTNGNFNVTQLLGTNVNPQVFYDVAQINALLGLPNIAQSNGIGTNTTISYPGNIWLKPFGSTGFQIQNIPSFGPQTSILIISGTSLTLNAGEVIGTWTVDGELDLFGSLVVFETSDTRIADLTGGGAAITDTNRNETIKLVDGGVWLPGVNALSKASVIPLTGNDGYLQNSNKVLMWITTTKTNIISDGR